MTEVSAADIGTEPVGTAEPKPKTRRVVPILALVIAVASLGSSGFLWFQLQDTKDDLRTSDQYLSGRIAELEDTVGYSTDFDSLTNRIDDLERQLGIVSNSDSLGRQISDLEDDLGSLSHDVDDIGYFVSVQSSAISELTGCVNTGSPGQRCDIDDQLFY